MKYKSLLQAYERVEKENRKIPKKDRIAIGYATNALDAQKTGEWYVAVQWWRKAQNATTASHLIRYYHDAEVAAIMEGNRHL